MNFTLIILDNIYINTNSDVSYTIDYPQKLEFSECDIVFLYVFVTFTLKPIENVVLIV